MRTFELADQLRASRLWQVPTCDLPRNFSLLRQNPESWQAFRQTPRTTSSSSTPAPEFSLVMRVITNELKWSCHVCFSPMTSASSVPQIMIINTVLTVTVIANEWNHGCCASFTRHRGGSVLDARSAWQLPVFQWDRAILGFRMVQRCSKEFRVVSSWPSRAAKPCTRFPAVYPQTFSDLPRLFVTFMSFVCGYQSGSGNPEIPDVGDPQPKAVISSNHYHHHHRHDCHQHNCY